MTDSTPYGTPAGEPDPTRGAYGAGQPGDAGQPANPSGPYGQPPAGSDPGAGGAWSPSGEMLATPEPRRRRGVIIGAGAAVLALAAAGGVYVATQLSGGGLKPSGVAPRSTFAFVQVDLDPAASQKLAVRDFANKFPDAPKGPAEDIMKILVTEALQQGDEDLNYERDVKPWLDKRVGIAGFTDSANKPQLVGILQVKDEAKAREALTRMAAESREVGDDAAFAIGRGYAVVTEKQEVADAVLRDSQKESLEDNKQFTEDVDVLTGDQVVTGWVDLQRSFELARSNIEEIRSLPLPASVTDQATGRLVIGAHAANDFAEVEGYVLGTKAELPGEASPSLLTDLPASTVIASSVNGLAAQADKMYSSLSGGPFDPEEFVTEFEEQLGLSVRQDVLPLLGNRLVIALGNLASDPSQVKAALISEVADPSRARATGQKLAQLGAFLGVPMQADVAGNIFYLTAGEGYLNTLKGQKGGLGSAPLFRKAMGDLGDKVAAAVYVDIAAITEAMGADDPNLKALHAFGMSAGVQGDRGYFRMRVVVR